MTDFSGSVATLDDWEKRIGHAIRQARINAGYDQVALAERANLSRSTVQALENGAGTRLRTLLAVLRALDRLDVFDSLIPETGPTPLELLAEARRADRRRATGPRRVRKSGR